MTTESRVVQGAWNEIKERLKEHWDQLTDEDLQIAEDNLDQLVGRIQLRTGATRDVIENYLEHLASRGTSTVTHVSETDSRRPFGVATKPFQPVTLDLKVRIEAIALPEAVGGYSVVVPALPGCFSEGDTIEEAMENAAEVIELWLAAQHDRNRERAIQDTVG